MSKVNNESDDLSEDTPAPTETIAENGEIANVDISVIGDDLAQNMPEVQEHAVESFIAEQNEIEQENAVATDKRGDRFDPSQHAVESDGSPKYTQAGYFAKKRGRKAGNAKSQLNTNEPQVNNVELDKRVKRAAAGQAAANAVIMLGMVIGGEEWQPIKNDKLGIDEKKNLEMAFTDFMEEKGVEDLPPNLALTIAVLGYALPRFTMPKTREKTKTGFSWLGSKIKAWWVNRKLKKHGLEAKEIKKEEK